MATDIAHEASANAQATAQAAPAGSPAKSGRNKNVLLIVALIATVMIAEAGAFYFLGLGGHGTQMQGEEKNTIQKDTDPTETQQDEFAEVDVDTFNVTNTRAASDVVVHVSFKLVAIVAKGQAIEFDEAANKVHKARVRQAVIEVARSSTLDELNDPSLSTFKRLIQEKVNKVLRRSYVSEMVVSDFKTIEQ